tara:strand:+ start:21 stop:911 length:891 start_codon:yes stop_codon:yes gene_type:complete
MDQAMWVRTNGCSEEQSDDDGDGVFNPSDGPGGIFKNDPTQSADSDSDGYGDNSNGTDGDNCPLLFGNSTEDRKGCIDSDGDGYSDPSSGWGLSQGADAWKVEPSQWSDFDGDGFYDNYDNPVWTATREDSWPGKYVVGARMADKCPTVASDISFPDPGCPEKESTFVLDNRDSSSGGGGIPTMLIVILVLVLLGLSGLFAAVMVKQGKSKKKKRKGSRRKRSPTRIVSEDNLPDVDDEIEQEWGSNEQIVEENEAPNWEWQGISGDDGVEWLEWPESSDSWWQRDESGYWVQWKQ